MEAAIPFGGGPDGAREAEPRPPAKKHHGFGNIELEEIRFLERGGHDFDARALIAISLREASRQTLDIDLIVAAGTENPGMGGWRRMREKPMRKRHIPADELEHMLPGADRARVAQD